MNGLAISTCVPILEIAFHPALQGKNSGHVAGSSTEGGSGGVSKLSGRSSAQIEVLKEKAVLFAATHLSNLDLDALVPLTERNKQIVSSLLLQTQKLASITDPTKKKLKVSCPRP